jgi:transcriptional regulator with GAF, ATPase, and Fis domain
MSYVYAVPGLNGVSNGVTNQDFPWIFKKAVMGETICVSRLDELPEEAAKDKETLRLRETKSLMFISYQIGGHPIGGMSFATIKKEIHFSPGLVDRLKMIGEILAGSFYRKIMEEKYQKCVIEAQSLGEHILPGDFPLRQETQNACNYEGVIGQSVEIKLVCSRMEQVAKTDSVVLITGDTGTGKGVIARTIHELSSRKDRKNVTVNCAALTPNLIESELFGRERGAYTGSTEMQIGRFELADKGTLVLDEITELPMDLQAKLLRAIQDGEIERLGSPRTIKVDARIIALTSRNLKEEVAKGRFRQDLFYRLNVFPIHMPSLRERKSDIPLLAGHFVEMYNRRMQKDVKTIPQDVMNEFMSYSWPGNVRELQHLIERAVIISNGSKLHLSEKLTNSEQDTPDENFITNLAEVEKRHIIRILEKANWRIEGSKGAAILLGLHPNTLRGRMQKLGIQIQKNTQ